jgi:hypothetical protein
MAEQGEYVFEIDIETRILGENEDMYVVRPGASFSLYDDFIRESAIFLDFPDLPLSLEVKPKAIPELRDIVARSLAIRDWHLGKADEPQRDPKAHKGTGKGRRIGKYVGAIQRLYYDLPVGTVVVIPSKSYVGDVLFGEITGPVERREAATAYRGEQMMLRPVRWLGKRQKAALSPALRDLLGMPIPVMQIARELRDEIAKYAFKQYAFKTLSSTKITTSEEDFSTLDDLHIQMFSNYIAALLAADEAGVKPGANLTLMDSLKYLHARRDLVPELDQSISSPGFQRFYNDHIAPLVIGALMTLALSGEAFAQDANIRIQNSAMLKGDPCAVQVEERVRSSLRLAHFDEFQTMCKNLQETKQNTGLKTSMKASKKKKK